MTDNLDPGTATRAALEEEIARLRSELEHAKAALAGDNEGIRLWMLDCGLSAQKAREQRDACLARLEQYDGEAYDRIRRQHAETYRELTAVRAQRDAARRDLAAATTALDTARSELLQAAKTCNDNWDRAQTAEAALARAAVVCDRYDKRNQTWAGSAAVRRFIRDIREVLPAAGDDPAAAGGETP